MTIIVVGAGLAGGTAVTELREQGYDGRLVLIGSEPHPPYEPHCLINRSTVLAASTTGNPVNPPPGWAPPPAR